MSTTQPQTTPPADTDPRPSLVGLSRARLAEEVASMDLPAFRARQIFHWIYHHGVTDFAAMTTLAGPLREKLAERYTLARPGISTEQTSVDGTRKWLLRLDDKREVESVYIPEEDRGALCVSSQVGCTLTCTFCHTGTQRLVRNLTAAEIVGQMMVARDSYGEWPSGREDRRITNIVLMGMGEPLYNYDNVAEALGVIMDGEGIGLSRRRITLSTSGIVPEIGRCGRELRVNLAISLHAVDNDLRDEIVPINRKWPIADLLDACREYATHNPSRRITFEYVMLKGINDSEAEAKELVRLIRGLPAKVNLIPFNPWPGAPYECSSDETIEKFANVVLRAGYASPVRRPRGRDILAACGQLKSASERARRSRRAAADQPAA